MPRSIDDDRYLTERRNKNGTVRYYWQPPGQKPVRLPDGPGMKMALTQLNQQRDAARSEIVAIEGTVAWVIGRYKESDRYQQLAKNTLTVYDRWLNEFGKMWGALPATAISTRVVIKFVEKYQTQPSVQRNAAAVLRNVLDEARYRGLITGANPASRLRLSSAPVRDAIWSTEDRQNWIEAAGRHRNHANALATYFYLLEYTAQRPGDVIDMRWSRYDGETIELAQQKTGKLLRVPCHEDLRRVLDTAKRNANSLFIVARRNGRPFRSVTVINEIFREVCDDAGIGRELQARDLRRTAAVRLGEAGATAIEIAAVTGHSIERSREILETYVPRTEPMGRNAIAKWERNEN